jgi:fatty-acyl-CoA synthase
MTLSHVHGSSEVPLLGETVGSLVDRIASRWPDRLALLVPDQGVRWSYAQFQKEVYRAAAGFLELGLEPGDRVGIWSPNNAESVITQFATAKAGLILVNINPSYRPNELEYALNKSGCKALILARAFKTSDYVGMIRSVAPELPACAPGALRAEKLPSLRLIVVIDNAAEPGTLAANRLSDAPTVPAM